METLISVIIPAYNAEKTIIKCLNTIWNQTVESLEIIIIDDGSIDNTLDIVNKYKKFHSDGYARKIQILNQSNSGPSAARNAGLNIAIGKYIAFVDSDDQIDLYMYENLIKIAEKNNLQVVMCNILNHYDSKSIPSEEIAPFDRVLNREDILKYICTSLMQETIFGGPCNKIYLRAFIERYNIRMPQNIDYGEDAVFQMQVFDHLDKTWIDKRCFYHYIHRKNSQSTAKLGRFKMTLEPLYKIRCYYGKKWEIDKRIIANYFVYCTIMDIINTLKSTIYKGKMGYLRTLWKSKLLKKAFSEAEITKNMYTHKIYYIYKLLKVMI